MKNLLNEELTLTWGPHHYESTFDIDLVREKESALIGIWFGKEQYEEDELSLFKANASFENNKWKVESFQVEGKRYHNDITDALCEVVIEYLDEYH